MPCDVTTFVLFALIVMSAPRTSNCASVGSIAQNINSDLLLLDANLALALPSSSSSRDSRRIDVNRFDVPSGGAIDLFYRYGFFSLSLRVVPRDDPGSWLVREPTSRVFDENSIVRAERTGPNTFVRQPMEISLCDDMEELKEAYFRSFRAEGIARPHRLFTGSWRIPTMAKYLGISADVLDGNSAFVLIKMTKNAGTIEIAGNGIRLSSNARSAADQIRAGDEDSVLEFVKRYGSHYIRSVTVGDAVYQVLVLSTENMRDLKLAIGGKKMLNLQDWDRLYATYLAPWKVKETGNIRVASGDSRLQGFVDETLRINGQFGSYPNMVEGLVKRPENVQMLEELGRDTTAIVSVDFASLKPFVGNNNIQVRQFFDEIIDTHSALWESNL